MAKLLIVDGLEWRLAKDVDTDKLQKDIKDAMESEGGKVVEIRLEIEGEVLLLNCSRSRPYAYLGVPAADGEPSALEAASGMPSMRSAR